LSRKPGAVQFSRFTRICPTSINLTEDILTMLTSITGHDSVLLRADDPLIDMNYITSFTGMTDKWFYKLISEGHFPKPIKLGRSSRWYKSEVEQWMQQRIEESRGAAA
ncbi:transcriptional regulator, AlpA family, partial [Escherichia coli 908675]